MGQSSALKEALPFPWLTSFLKWIFSDLPHGRISTRSPSVFDEDSARLLAKVLLFELIATKAKYIFFYLSVCI